MSGPNSGQHILADGIDNQTDKGDPPLYFTRPSGNWPASLDEFRQFWDESHRVGMTVIEGVDSQVYFLHNDGKEDIYPFSNSCPGASGGQALKLTLRVGGDPPVRKQLTNASIHERSALAFRIRQRLSRSRSDFAVVDSPRASALC